MWSLEERAVLHQHTLQHEASRHRLARLAGRPTPLLRRVTWRWPVRLRLPLPRFGRSPQATDAI